MQLQQSKNVQKTIQKLTANLPMSGINSSSAISTPKIHTAYQYGNADTNFFNKITSLLATPVRRSEIVGGYMLGYGAVAIVQTIVIVATTLWLLKTQVVGSLALIF
ncbi:hypothetical protein PO185_07645 [Limosilactobacillus mucosae]|uniref:hypothetical protein n=1 Tax=Limosilactobacillus mucosae TaxID=97478 RepID=UPI00233F00C5|nr:hypothetical protein [Limosilactobacillus mucosae]MDC2840126.1 hypothetical protein [Limosilactobacillus mucosae]MDC2841104.1 hypothetical protein [Limosilactobacillus mucosae]MDC2845514.1 hypothetical protein [Limosilactobacillus mucosae]